MHTLVNAFIYFVPLFVTVSPALAGDVHHGSLFIAGEELRWLRRAGVEASHSWSISGSPEYHSGVLIEARGGLLVIARSSGDTLVNPWQAFEGIQVRRTISATRRGAWIGGIVGAVVGVLVGGTMIPERGPCQEFICLDGMFDGLSYRANGLFLGCILGSLVGAGIGSTQSIMEWQAPQWRESAFRGRTPSGLSIRF